MSSQILKRAVLFWGSEQKAAPRAQPAKKAVNPYHAVCVIPGSRACAAAQGIEGQRFLSRDAPSLPLKGCTRGQCECRYGHHEDRRKGPRRARDMGVAVDGYEGEDQRLKQKRGRRKNDKT